MTKRERYSARALLSATVACALVVFGPTAIAGVDPQGREVRVNNVRKGLQLAYDLAMDPKGRSIAVWENRAPNGAYHVYARRYNARGRPAGKQFKVDQGPNEGAGSPAVGVSRAGSFVVAWAETEVDVDSDVMYRLFTRRGRARTPELAAADGPTSDQTPTVAVRADGAFTLVWNLYQGTPSDFDYDVRARRFTPEGKPAGDEFGVSTRTALNQRNASATYDPSGKLIVVWESEKPLPGSASKEVVDARRFDRSGHPLGKEIQVSSDDPSVRLSRPQRASGPDVDTDAKGRYIVTWGSLIESGYGDIALARRFDAHGKRIGKELVLKANTRFYDDPPRISMDHKGRFVAVWGVTHAERRIGDVQDLMGARFTSRAKRVGHMFRLHARRPPNQVGASVALDDDWRFMAIWTRYSMCGPPGDKYACRYDVLMRRWHKSRRSG